MTAIGSPVDRIDAKLKVTGRATYAAETPVANVAHAVIVGSAIGRGAIRSLVTDNAVKAPGVIAVITHETAPRLPPAPPPKGPGDRVLQLLQDDSVLYQDQPIAVVLADTLEHAQHAATLVGVRYDAKAPVTEIEAQLGAAYDPVEMVRAKANSSRGDVDGALAGATVKIIETYTTPVENHNPMEPHATIAVWQGPDRLTVYDSTQGIFAARDKLARTFGLEPKRVRVIDHFVGGGFGCKGTPWSHVALAALAAKAVGRPVKLVVTRQQMFSLVGHRPHTIQTIALGADRTGRLVAMRNQVVAETSRFDQFVEPAAMPTRHLYMCPNVETTTRLVRIDAPTPTFMRAPGQATGTYALECAMDELAYALNIDPLELRLRNDALLDNDERKPYSSKSLRHCYEQAAQRFGWAQRTAKPGSMRDGKTLIGWGMATAVYPSHVQPASAIARLRRDGSVVVQCGTQDLGTGTYTILTQIAADALGLPIDRVQLELGDTTFPEGPLSGGSMTAASAGNAVKAACDALRDKLISLSVADTKSPLFDTGARQIQLVDGALVSSGRRDPLTATVERSGLAEISAEHRTEPSKDRERYSCYAFGADFCEVRIDPELGEIRIPRFVAAFASGTILNPKTARSQYVGGIIFGIGMALFEQTVRDRRNARVVTRDLADYHVPVNADVGAIDVIIVDEHDPHVNPLGIKGIGEIGVTGTPAAIANAVFHATGKRIRDLPITLDKLLQETS